VLLLNLREEILSNRFVSSWPAAFAIAAALLFSIINALRSFVPGPSGDYSIGVINEQTHTKALGQVLYTEFIFPFEIASLVLLVAIIGAIVLAKKRMRS
jgi:NADH-quinone oxidoreductase subunit J